MTNTEIIDYLRLGRQHELEAADELERQAKEIEVLKATAWLGCNECDCDFNCYDGKTRCIRLLEQAKEIEVLKDRVARYTKYAIGADVEIEALKAEIKKPVTQQPGA